MRTRRMCFLQFMEKLCNFLRFLWRRHDKSNYQNGQYGDCIESDSFYGDSVGKISVEYVWGFHEENMVIQIARQSPN